MKLRLIIASALLAACGAPALAQTVTVNWSQDDTVDFGGAERVADLPGPDGHITFAEAVFAANNTPGPQTIAFAVPRASWWTLFGSDICYFRHELMNYVSGDDTTIDFTTQTAFTGDTNPNGNEVAFYYAGAPAGIPNIWLAGDRITLRGVDRLLGNNFEEGLWVSGNDCRVVGCTTTGLTIRGLDGGGDRNIIGGTGPGEGNTFAGPTDILSNADNNIVIGNIFRFGLRISGDTLYGTCDDNRIGGPTTAERNVFSGHGYSGEEGFPDGNELEVYHANNTRIEGNYVGTSDNGFARYTGRTGVGGVVVNLGAVNTIVTGNTVGGIERTGSNHYQGQRFGVGIAVVASASGTQVLGNRVGVGVDGITPILNVQGITVQSNPNGTPSNTIIQDNIISTSETSGVRILNAGSARISGNAIFTNGALGIDLGTAGVTPNDPNDGDQGPNGLQNFPNISNASSGSGQTRITGTLDSTPNRAFVIEFFSGSSCDPSGFGEGAVYLGNAHVRTDPAGSALFEATIPTPTAVGAAITATATDAVSLGTSEFSACRTVEAAACPADFDGDGFITGLDFDAYTAAFEAGEPSSDFDGDGFITGLDFDAFVGAFESGC